MASKLWITAILLLGMTFEISFAQEVQPPWNMQNAPRSGGAAQPPTTGQTPDTANGLHQSYFSEVSGPHDPRYYDSRGAWMNPVSPTGIVTMNPNVAIPSVPGNFGGQNATFINPGVGQKVQLVVNVWNAFTGNGFWKGLGKVFSLAVATRVRGASGMMNPNLAMDQRYLQRSPNQPWSNTGGRVVAPDAFHTCEDCDRYYPNNPNGQVGDVFRNGQPFPTYNQTPVYGL